jgi:hypothetical protein
MKSYKFVILENRKTGKRSISENTPTIDLDLFEVCGCADTRAGCYPLLFLMKPAKTP